MTDKGERSIWGRISTAELPEWLRDHFSDTQRYLILWIVIGILCGLVAVAFHLSIVTVFSFVWMVGENAGTLGLIGVMLAAVFGHLFVKYLLELRRWFRTGSEIPRWLQPAIGGFGVGLLEEAGFGEAVKSATGGIGMLLADNYMVEKVNINSR